MESVGNPVGAADEELRQVLTAVCQGAGAALETGRAELTVDHSGERGEIAILRLIPKRTSACRASVQIDWWQQVTFYLGRHETPAELFSRDRSELLSKVQAWTRAVVEGNYIEYIRIRNASHQAMAWIGAEDEQERISYNVWLPGFLVRAGRHGWVCERYEPF